MGICRGEMMEIRYICDVSIMLKPFVFRCGGMVVT